MVAYNFKPQFVARILDGSKGGTIRGERRRHARPGEEMQLYTGMRTKHCRLVARRTCIAIDPIVLDFGRRRIDVGDRVFRTECELAAFARFDGFGDFDQMRYFWSGSLDLIIVFNGWHIRWFDLPVETR